MTTETSGMGQTITSAVATKLRDQIRTGILVPGSRLRQKDVARTFNVSTTPVREAFMMLEREGLVTRSDHRGVVVFNPTVADLREIYMIRMPLEVLATEEAAAHLTEADLARMEEILSASEHAHEIHDVPASRRLNEEFHATIYQAANLPRLLNLIGTLRAASASYIQLSNVFKPLRADTEREHRAILQACRDRSPVRAGEAMSFHLQHTVQVVSEGLATLGEPQQ